MPTDCCAPAHVAQVEAQAVRAPPDASIAVDWNVPLAHGVHVTSLVAVPAAAKNVPTGQLVDQAVHEAAELEADV